MRRGVLIIAGLAVGAIGVVAFAPRDQPDTPKRIAKECRFIADLEARRMVRRKDYGPARFEVWRATDKTSGSPRPETKDLPWEMRLLARPPAKPQAAIDCGSALDGARVPKVQVYNDGPLRQAYRFQYSRIVFSPGDRYAAARITICEMRDGLWDESSGITIWRRRNGTWQPLDDETTLLQLPPTRRPPIRCFETPAP
ncbi:hypothetical protein [Caulobacter sp.]|uniref:hypothetical protein n=1 Tax=Caulobacter sp. TaxID=78 RepID=UPI001B0699A5|nr:hypothetical protein [Caulobacter sp.]MBO9546698.1 hypothetical protein [Caulobacter sp.]